jgi:hypothetical protein
MHRNAGPNDTEISVILLYDSNIGKVTNIKILNVTGFPRTEVSFTKYRFKRI